MSKRKPAEYGHLSCEDPRFGEDREVDYDLNVLYDIEKGCYVFRPDVRENYPGEFPVGAFDRHLKEFRKTDLTPEVFRDWLTPKYGGRFAPVSDTVKSVVWRAFETFAFDDGVLCVHANEIEEHGIAHNRFLDFCYECDRCRRERIGVDDTGDGGIPLTKDDGRDYCDADQQRLCAVIWAMRRIEKRLAGKPKAEDSCP